MPKKVKQTAISRPTRTAFKGSATSDLYEVTLLWQSALFVRNNENAAIFHSYRALKADPAAIRRELRLGASPDGPQHSEVATILGSLASLYLETGQHQKAAGFCLRELGIREKSLGPYHPETAKSLRRMGDLSLRQKNLQQAEDFYQKALKIQDASLAETHPDLALTLDSYASLLKATHRKLEAASLHRRAQAILRSDPTRHTVDAIDLLKDPFERR